MGKKHRARRTVLAAPTAVSPRASHRPTHPTIPSDERDFLTGEPLRAGSLRLVYRDYNPARPDAERQNIPLRLHVNTVEGRLGGHRFSSPYRRYLATPWHDQDIVQQQRNHARHIWLNWWSPTWAERELYATFPADAVEAVLAVQRDGADWQTVAAHVKHTIAWIARWERSMARHCRQILLEFPEAA